MRAVCLTEFGGVDKVHIRDLPNPTPGPRQALVKVKAAALNHLDLWVLKGRPGVTLQGPHVLGSDASGTVEAFGSDCSGAGVQLGSEVVINPGVGCMTCEACLKGLHSECPNFKIMGFQLPGTYADYVVIPAVNLHPKPKHLNWQEAAALPLSHLTAWRMLFTRANLQPGEVVLIHGIGSGVSSAALQLVRMAGATAIVTSSSDCKLAKAQALGALTGFNYRSESDLVGAIRKATGGRGVDVAFDNAGAATLAVSMGAVRRGGRIVTCGVTAGAEAQINLQQLYWNHITLLGSTMGSSADMRQLVCAVEAEALIPVIDKEFPLSKAREALERMRAGDQMGKIVLRLD